MHTNGRGRCRWRAKRTSPPRLRGRGADAGLPLCFLKWLTDEEGERRMKKSKKNNRYCDSRCNYPGYHGGVWRGIF